MAPDHSHEVGCVLWRSVDVRRADTEDEGPMSIRFPSSRNWRDSARLIRFALLGTLIGLAFFLGPPWFEVFVTPSMQFHGLIGLLQAARSAYIAFLMALPAAILLLAGALVLARRRSARRAWLARALACGVALAIATALAEGTSAARLEAMRVPMPRLKTRFADPPGDRTVDVVVVGESSAAGVPYQGWLSVGEIVAWELREAIPERTFSVTCQAKPGIKLDQMHQLLGDLERRPDLVILYAGHNEFSMRHDCSHGAPHYLDETPPARMTLVGLVRSHSRVCLLIDETTGLLLRAAAPTRSVTRQPVDVPVYTASEYAERLHDFRVRLEAMTAYCERVGALAVLVIPPGNDADFDPNRSFLPPETPRAARAAFAREFEAARRLEASDPAGAVAAYRRLLESQPRFAETHYRLARLEERAGRREEADRHYVAARDCDGLPMRCLSDFQEIYREVAANHPGAILIDGPAVLRRLSPRGTAGDTFFTDGFHPSLIGYTALAEAVLRRLHARRAFGWGESSPTPAPVVTPADCARHFAMDPKKWQDVCGYAAWFYSQTSPVRFDPTERLAKQARYGEASRRIEAGTDPEAVGMPGIGTRIAPAAQLAAAPGEAGREVSSNE
jgi:lysophospholipase L1-like esterase